MENLLKCASPANAGVLDIALECMQEWNKSMKHELNTATKNHQTESNDKMEKSFEKLKALKEQEKAQQKKQDEKMYVDRADELISKIEAAMASGDKEAEALAREETETFQS